MIGVKSAGVISNWEQDVSKPDANKMVRLCEALGISLSYLLDYYGKENAPLYSSEAQKLAQDYDSLDGHGQRLIRLVADEELARCMEPAEPSLRKVTADQLVAMLKEGQLLNVTPLQVSAIAQGGETHESEADTDIKLPGSVQAVPDEYKEKTDGKPPAPEER